MLSIDDTDLNIALNVLDFRRDIDVEINQIIESNEGAPRPRPGHDGMLWTLRPTNWLTHNTVS